MSNTFTQREKQIIEEVYILLYGPSSGWDGKKNLSAKWEDPNGDKLLDDVISDSCENV